MAKLLGKAVIKWDGKEIKTLPGAKRLPQVAFCPEDMRLDCIDRKSGRLSYILILHAFPEIQVEAYRVFFRQGYHGLPERLRGLGSDMRILG